MPRLKLIASTGFRNAAIDIDAAAERSIVVTHTGYDGRSTIEMTWALILASVRQVASENAYVAPAAGSARWATVYRVRPSVFSASAILVRRLRGSDSRSTWKRSLGARISRQKGRTCGARLVSKEELFRNADIVTIHLVLSPRTKGLVGAAELQGMKRSARLINTSRGPIVNEPALIQVLRERRIAGAALDVFDIEPLPADHPFRSFDNVLSTPHIGYVARDLYRTFYGDTVKNITRWLAQQA